MHVMVEASVIFGLCLLGEGLVALLPIPFPASVISMVLLAALLLVGWVKEDHIQRFSSFLIQNMAFFFLPTAVGILEHLHLLDGTMMPVLAIIVLTVPVVYGGTAWTVRLLMGRTSGKGDIEHGQ